MKSVFLSILMFVGVFFLAGTDFLSVIEEDWFHYSTYFVFTLVMLCALYVTLFKTRSAKNNNSSEDMQNNAPKIEQKEENHDEQ